MQKPRIAVLLPCCNEGPTIAKVVRDFRAALGPDAAIYVYDNRSEDNTAAEAAAAGAIVCSVLKRGKGNVVRRMFADIDADIYLMADGDSTYHAASAPHLVSLLWQGGLDMVVGKRFLPVGVDGETGFAAAYRPGHQFGNRQITRVVRQLFGPDFSDVLSGYRAFSRRFVKSFPGGAAGFEIETELTVHALDLGMPSAEVLTPYAPRPRGSFSKLHSLRDGYRILATIFRLLRHNRPLSFFGSLFALLAVCSIGLGTPLIVGFIETGLVPRFPTAILATGIMLLAFLSLVCGFILDAVGEARREAKRLAYLAQSIPRQNGGSTDA